MRRRYRPIQINTWVDDCPQVHVGEKDFLLEHVPVAAAAFAGMLMDQGFQVTNKTTITSSSAELAGKIQAEVKKVSKSVQVAASGTDVGCDLAGGKKRRVTLQKFRISKVKSSSRIVCKLSKKCQDFRKLGFTGIKSNKSVSQFKGQHRPLFALPGLPSLPLLGAESLEDALPLA